MLKYFSFCFAAFLLPSLSTNVVVVKKTKRQQPNNNKLLNRRKGLVQKKAPIQLYSIWKIVMGEMSYSIGGAMKEKKKISEKLSLVRQKSNRHLRLIHGKREQLIEVVLKF